MKKEGLYKVFFITPYAEGRGLIVLSGGRVWGGDDALYYAGEYTLEGNKFTATIKTARHSSPPLSKPVFGKDRVTINIEGKFEGTHATLTGTSPDAPGVGMSAMLELLPEI